VALGCDDAVLASHLLRDHLHDPGVQALEIMLRDRLLPELAAQVSQQGLLVEDVHLDEDLPDPVPARALAGLPGLELLRGQDAVMDQHLAQRDPPRAPRRLRVVRLCGGEDLGQAPANLVPAWMAFSGENQEGLIVRDGLTGPARAVERRGKLAVSVRMIRIRAQRLAEGAHAPFRLALAHEEHATTEPTLRIDRRGLGRDSPEPRHLRGIRRPIRHDRRMSVWRRSGSNETPLAS
jgi:hypothetical protein